MVSTPTIRGISRIEREYELSDQRKYMVPCPECGTHQWLKFEQLKWPKGETKAKIKELCNEVDAARNAQTAIVEARKNVEGKTLEVPYQCGIAVEDLERVGNDWARGKLVDVTRACYVEPGAAILPATVPGMQLNCDYQVDQIYKVVKKYNLKDAAIDPWIEKSTAKCSGATASAAG